MWKKENLRKNFLRVKQLADQNLGRSEKSEVLSEDLLAIEKRVETVKQVCSNINKKLGSSLQAQGENIEKRLKKLPETSLAHTLIESSTLLGTGTESVLGLICQLCGEAQNILAREQLQYEINVEKEVLGPLQAIFDNDIPAIMKARKHLTKTTLDMDSAKGRLTTAVRQSHVPGTNIASAAAKADVIKEEYEEASAKVEHVKDSLAVEMSNFIAKETEHSQKLLALVEAQAAYHKKALEAIQVVIPRMQHAIENNPTKPVFGHPLEEHLRVTGRDIAVVLEACVMTLLLTGMDEEGLFRIGGASSKLKKLKACFDANIVDMEEFRHDPHTVAGALKQYLRELPEPLLTYQLYSDFMEAASLPKDKLHPALKKVVDTLPRINYNNFRYLIKFLDKLAKNSDKNKMSAGNIAIVIAPNLLWSPGENAPNMLTTGSLSTIIDAILSNADFFFPGEFDFSNVGEHTPPSMSPSQTRADQRPLEINSTLAIQSNNLSVSPSINRPVSPVSPGIDVSYGQDNQSPEQYGTQKRTAKKPAPPPPPDRPYTVAVTASVTKQNTNPYQTWPRHQGAPLASPEIGSSTVDIEEETIPTKPAIVDRPHPPDRPTGPPPDRPKAPPPLAPHPQGHNRSASTGAMFINQQAPLQESPNGQGLFSSRESLENEPHILTSPSDSSLSSFQIDKHGSSKRASRPTPPPPPPPLNKESEDTHL
ncbi:rho GTPase-activating protein 44 isoform X7 [Patella vulgata]|uniref:rho GTPase-activating protein 44 isoform X7 n=1 Tax=Patella vulgata TaxID=6465 RepID=UPI0024A96F53|nr:rho GTPase-activating protein 44 isoform X7 [Patella vulgata]